MQIPRVIAANQLWRALRLFDLVLRAAVGVVEGWELEFSVV